MAAVQLVPEPDAAIGTPAILPDITLVALSSVSLEVKVTEIVLPVVA